MKKNKIITPIIVATTIIAASGIVYGASHFLTPIYQNITRDRANAAFYRLLDIESSGDSEVAILSADVSKAGVTNKNSFYEKAGKTNFIGSVYRVSVDGFGDAPIVFQIGLKGTTYTGVEIVSHSETASYGGIFLDLLDDLVVGKTIDPNLEMNAAPIWPSENVIGHSTTGDPVKKAIRVISADYLADKAVK